jgi:hypothetical protein
MNTNIWVSLEVMSSILGKENVSFLKKKKNIARPIRFSKTLAPAGFNLF